MINFSIFNKITKKSLKLLQNCIKKESNLQIFGRRHFWDKLKHKYVKNSN